MSEETENDGQSPDERVESLSEIVECDSHTLIFPRGAEQFADDNDAHAIRISSKTADIEVLDKATKVWIVLGKAPVAPKSTGTVASIKPAK